MLNYLIKKNGYTIGQAKGKKKAIDIVKYEISDGFAIWGRFEHGVLNVYSYDGSYTIEENKGEL